MKTLKKVAVIVAFGFGISITNAQVDPVDANNLAIGGYDLVSYFTVNKAVKGSKNHAAVYNGVTYYFSSEKNLKAFNANPTNYLPEVGGYCAWGVSEKGVKFSSNPETFKIVNGKLYLFFNGDFNGGQFNTLTEWNKDEATQLKNIQPNWEKISKSE